MPFETDPAAVVEDAALVLNGGGWGHGVGMSQYGAMGAATLGCTYATILTTYYPGTTLTTLESARPSVAVHLMKRALEPTTIRTTSAAYSGVPLDWVACELDGVTCEVVATQPAGSEWKVRPLKDGTFVLYSSGDGLSCPVTGATTADPSPSPSAAPSPSPSPSPSASPAPSPSPTVSPSPSPSPTVSPSPSPSPTAPPPGCEWRGGDIETRLRMQHDGTVIRILEADSRRVKWGFTEFDYSSVNDGTTYVTQYVTGTEDGSLSALDRYLRGLAEMPSSWHAEALKTQAVAGRSYAEATIRNREAVYGRHEVGGYIDRAECRCDIFATTVDQVYTGWDREEAETGSWRAAVDATARQVLTYDGNVVAAFYSSSHGGWSEDVEHVWGTAIPYLPAVDTSRWEAAATRSEERPWGNTRHRWTRSFTAADLAARLGLAQFLTFDIESRGPGGRPTRLGGGGVVVTGKDQSGATVTKRLSGESLRSKLSLFSSLVYIEGEATGKETQASDTDSLIEAACPSAEVPEDGFADLVEGATHEAAVDCLVWWQVANGRTADTYAPKDSVRRDQMASFLTRVLVAGGVELPSEPLDHFDDDTDSSHHLAINQLAELGLVNGVAERTYGPASAVTRAQMASFLVRVFERIAQRELAAGEDRFSDDDGTTHEANINKVAAAGFAQGVEVGRYAPDLQVTRAQMGSFLARLLAQLVTEERATPPSSGDDSGS